MASRQQQTLNSNVSIEGFGYWSGKDVIVRFEPAEPGTGIVFVRTDLDPQARIPARVEHRVEIPRRTTLRVGSASVEMVEHILAALFGLYIDNCEVHVDQVEMPGLDGSSRPIADALLSAGIVEQEMPRPTLTIRDVTRVGTDDAWVEARPLKDDRTMTVRYYLDYGLDTPIGRHRFQLNVTPQSFLSELSAARTFITQKEADSLRQQGLAHRATHDDLLVFDDEGLIENDLRFGDECVRHKALDLLGDLALCACDLHGDFVGHRSGHRLNSELVRVLLSESKQSLPAVA